MSETITINQKLECLMAKAGELQSDWLPVRPYCLLHERNRFEIGKVYYLRTLASYENLVIEAFYNPAFDGGLSVFVKVDGNFLEDVDLDRKYYFSLQPISDLNPRADFKPDVLCDLFFNPKLLLDVYRLSLITDLALVKRKIINSQTVFQPQH